MKTCHGTEWVNILSCDRLGKGRREKWDVNYLSPIVLSFIPLLLYLIVCFVYFFHFLLYFVCLFLFWLFSPLFHCTVCREEEREEEAHRDKHPEHSHSKIPPGIYEATCFVVIQSFFLPSKTTWLFVLHLVAVCGGLVIWGSYCIAFFLFHKDYRSLTARHSPPRHRYAC